MKVADNTHIFAVLIKNGFLYWNTRDFHVARNGLTYQQAIFAKIGIYGRLNRCNILNVITVSYKSKNHCFFITALGIFAEAVKYRV